MKTKIVRRFMSVLLMVTMVFQAVTANAVAIPDKTSTGLLYVNSDYDTITEIESGKSFLLSATIGAASAEISETSIQTYIELGDSPLEFTNFDNKGFTDGATYSVDGNTYTMRVRDDNTRYIAIDENALKEGRGLSH